MLVDLSLGVTEELSDAGDEVPNIWSSLRSVLENFLEDAELAQMTLCFHLSMDLFCEEMHVFQG